MAFLSYNSSSCFNRSLHKSEQLLIEILPPGTSSALLFMEKSVILISYDFTKAGAKRRGHMIPTRDVCE